MASTGKVRVSIDHDAERLDQALPDIDWKTIPDGIATTTFSVPSGNLAAIVAGDAARDRVVLVPGATGSKEDFLFMFPLLVGAGFRVESFDLAGQYESASAGPERLDPPRSSYDNDLFVDDLVAVLERGSTPVHVLGYSFAATVAQLAFAHRPELFASLTLLSSPPVHGQVFRSVKRIGFLSAVASADIGAALMIWGVSNNLNRASPGRVRFVRERFRLTRRESVTDIIALMRHTPDLRDVIGAAGIPLLVAVGTHDLWPVQLHEVFAQAIGADLAVYETGHSPCETAPHQLVADMLRMIGGDTVRREDQAP